MIHKLLPVNPNSIVQLNSHSNLVLHNGDEVQFNKFQVALLGYDTELCNPIRQSFYIQEFGVFQNLHILDLGDSFALSNTEIAILVQDLIQANVFPILFGFPTEIVSAISKQWEAEFLPHTLAWINSQIPNELEEVLSNNIYIKHQYFIGLQRQYTNIRFLNNPSKNIVPVYLSEFRKSIQSIDSYARNAELFYFNLAAIRHSDFPASINPSGFFSEEIISIAKLSGSSDRSLISIISDWDNLGKSTLICNNLIAQMMWYVIEGYALKLNDKKNKNGNLTHYVVEVKNTDQHLDFYKSEISGKWWLKEPTVDSEIQGKLIPCTYDEYLRTVHENIPERLLELIYH